MILIAKSIKQLNFIHKSMAKNIQNRSKTFSTKSFTEAIETLNTLQTNSAALSMSIRMKRQQVHDEANFNLRETEKFLQRVDGFNMRAVDQMSVIHVSGSKGKGSVCNFTEAILREHNVKTGLFTSPHLESCTERIKLFGVPIDKSTFCRYFWEVYEALDKKKSNEYDMPSYFKFLQIMAFYIFVNEQVDVAIIEVGIGGLYDSTNILRNTEIVGITSLQLEHTQLLGDTIEEIAWQKTGIIKPGSYVYYMRHSKDSVNELIRERFKELNGKRLSAVPQFDEYKWIGCEIPDFKHSSEINKINFSMALQISSRWLRNRNILSEAYFTGDILTTVDVNFVKSLDKCKLEGRFQEIELGGVNFFLDGAHTKESMDITSKWFQSRIQANGINVLVFNVTGERNPQQILQPLSEIHFDQVCFTTNSESSCSNRQSENFDAIHQSLQYDRCFRHRDVWLEMTKEKGDQQRETRIECFSTIQQTINYLHDMKDNNILSINVLVTGSLHLVGGVLKIIKSMDNFEAIAQYCASESQR